MSDPVRPTTPQLTADEVEFERVRAFAERLPDDAAGVAALLEGVRRGCAGGRFVGAYDLLWRRALRQTEYYALSLGLIDETLRALAGFFDPPWTTVVEAIAEDVGGHLLGIAGAALRRKGRFAEAIAPMQACLGMAVAAHDWRNASIAASNLSATLLTLGRIAEARALAQEAVDHADRSGDAFDAISARTALGDALLQGGTRRLPALDAFVDAEARQAADDPARPALYGLGGHRLCDLLLVPAERAVWRRLGSACSDALNACVRVKARATEALGWVRPHARGLAIALHRLSRGRAALYLACLSERPDALQLARADLNAAVAGLRAAHQPQFLPQALMARAHLRHVDGRRVGEGSAHADLDEAFARAMAEQMRLAQADVHLYRARLFVAEAYPWQSPAMDLAAAERLIAECGYARRLAELDDARRPEPPDPPTSAGAA